MKDMPLFVVIDGLRWGLFSVQYQHQGADFSFYIYARDREHAECMVVDIRKGAELSEGEIIGKMDHEPTMADFLAADVPFPTIN